MATPKKPESLLVLKVSLEHSDPPIWRTVQVPAEYTLAQLHEVIILSMGWEDSHLHQFKVGDEYYSHPLFQLDDALDEHEITLAEVFPKSGGKIRYDYDFGDDWIHIIKCEGRAAEADAPQIPWCVGGELACPPEDIGGIWGYYEFLGVLAGPKNARRREMVLSYGKVDPDHFDLAATNARLAKWEKDGKPIRSEIVAVHQSGGWV